MTLIEKSVGRKPLTFELGHPNGRQLNRNRDVLEIGIKVGTIILSGGAAELSPQNEHTAGLQSQHALLMFSSIFILARPQSTVPTHVA